MAYESDNLFDLQVRRHAGSAERKRTGNGLRQAIRRGFCFGHLIGRFPGTYFDEG
jgi:hypothetical protein